jgi:hypothetical protein
MSAYPKSALYCCLSVIGVREGSSLPVTCVKFAWYSGARRFLLSLLSVVTWFCANLLPGSQGVETLRRPTEGMYAGLFSFDRVWVLVTASGEEYK